MRDCLLFCLQDWRLVRSFRLLVTGHFGLRVPAQFWPAPAHFWPVAPHFWALLPVFGSPLPRAGPVSLRLPNTS